MHTLTYIAIVSVSLLFDSGGIGIAYETTKRAVEQEMKPKKGAWSAIYYCLLLRGTTRHEMLYQSNFTHIAANGFDTQPTLHDLLTIGNEAAEKHLPKKARK